MLSDNEHIEGLFPEAAQNWDLNRLYADLQAASGKEIKPFEKACLRGLLSRYRPGQLAFKLAWTSGALRVELNKGLYRSIEAICEQPINTLRWEKVPEWLETKGYKMQRQNLHKPITNSSITSQASLVDWGEAPNIQTFYGRTEDLTKLEQWLVRDRCHLLAICGMGGIGKTALTVKLVENIQSQFDCLIWRSLRGAQPTAQLITDLLQFLNLSQQAGSSISDLLEILRQKRCLIVLDDFEATLQDGELVGAYRQGCELYADLLQRVGSERHKSSLILIGREQPKEISMNQGEDQPIRYYKVNGLQRQGAFDLLRARGFKGSENGLDALIQQYRGNPSALRIVAGTIHELFNGNVSEFLKQTALALGDVLRTLLYEQFERLSKLEKDVLYWLAIKHRPVSLTTLRSEMNLQATGSELIDALESLRWRSLIEKVSEQGEVMFLLEPVVLKYVSRQFVEEVNKEITAITMQQNLKSINLLQSHILVEDRAPDSIRAMQIRLVLKPIKDKLNKVISQNNIELETLRELLASHQQTKLAEGTGYIEVNLALIGLWW
ncbi:MAG: NB-ARC domain-containing protein [Pseudanabaena sp. CoA8_M7]|nr:NB-ARC domain-containing protein [Pseudanabaena sp. M53BS1SP1A06MG]MCA6581135.1 NB-ARC domain-containing protein [Pseudanabaena sp. M34BS1SP1A06MG]MCA6592537.1 NB-ARC domain-containing protein [Pseudanabaena sp. M38BS1SP1A06MG]MCA6601309.1 NB-ARC domain-containing protein [Pseudanabaena sp. M57BS1SP1A06MG]MCE2977887.1 NB-ARC domain-containing protein [Pseudanabaena sp. CoA8_M7]